jgi:hypothetical protein
MKVMIPALTQHYQQSIPILTGVPHVERSCFDIGHHHFLANPSIFTMYDHLISCNVIITILHRVMSVIVSFFLTLFPSLFLCFFRNAFLSE